MTIKTAFTLSLMLVVSSSIFSPAYSKVKKCQDAQGKWHYGNDLRGICRDEADIQEVKERIAAVGNTSGGGSASDAELKRLELKVLDRTEYLTSDLKKILAPYSSESDVQNRFNRLKEQTSQKLESQEKLAEALEDKQSRLIVEKQAQRTPEDIRNTDVQISDNQLRLDNARQEVEALTTELAQIEQRRAKVLTLFRQFKDSPNLAEPENEANNANEESEGG